MWHGGVIAVERSWVQFGAVPLLCNYPGQLIQTRVPLSPSSIVWYCDWEGSGSRGRWHGGAAGWVLNLQSRGHGFDSRLLHGCVTTLSRLSTPLCPVTERCNLVPVSRQWRFADGRVMVGLALHWPCVMHFSDLTAYVLKACERKMTTLPMLQWNTLLFIWEGNHGTCGK